MLDFFIYRHSPFRQHKTKDKHEIDRLTLTYVSMVNKKNPLTLYVRTGDSILRLQLETGPLFYVVIQGTKGLAACMAKGVTLFLSYLKTLSIGPAPEIKLATSRSAVKRSTA